jgi:hypothetical protein
MVKLHEKAMLQASSLSHVSRGLKVFVPQVGKPSYRLINRARNHVGFLDKSLFLLFNLPIL